MKNKQLIIDNVKVGLDCPIFIVAELSANHFKDKEIIFKTIQAAADCGVNALKIQTFKPESMTIDSEKDFFKISNGSPWDGGYLFDLYKEIALPYEWHEEIFNFCKEKGLICFSTPFDSEAVDFLETLNVPAYKIASFEIGDVALVKKIASQMKPVILSTGIASLSEIQKSIQTCHSVGNKDLILLHCTSSYPTPFEQVNLKKLPNMCETFDCLGGISDHTQGATVPILSVSLGAVFIEKHFILDRSLGGPDASFSMEPLEMKALVDSVREAEKALGRVSYQLNDYTEKSRVFGRSLFVVKDIKEGEAFTKLNIRSIRPGHGIPSKFFAEVVGRRALKAITRGSPLSWEDIC